MEMITDRHIIFCSLPKNRIPPQLIVEKKNGKAWDKVCDFFTDCTSNKSDKQTKTEWDTEVNDFQKAIDYLINEKPCPKFTFEPVELITALNRPDNSFRVAFKRYGHI